MTRPIPSAFASLSHLHAAAADLLFPPRCLACDADQPTTDGPALCDACHGQLRVIDWPVCRRCAGRVPAPLAADDHCGQCRETPLKFDRAFALGAYEGLLRELLLRMKTDGNDLLARMLADCAWRRLRGALTQLQIDVVTCVPMHPLRRWQRGANPPRAIAEFLAARLRIPSAPRMLRLRRNVPIQLGLSRPGRFRNMLRQMVVAKGYYLDDACVLIVDDILTTGATCSEAARALKRAGAADVTVLTLARTENAF